jgi:hypothetical protein
MRYGVSPYIGHDPQHSLEKRLATREAARAGPLVSGSG